MKRLLVLLLLGLAACADYTGPDGSRIYGPEKRYIAPRSDVDFLLAYTVEGFQPTHQEGQHYLQRLAQEAVEDDGNTGLYTVLFLDKESGAMLLTVQFSVVEDLMFSNKLHLERLQ